VVDISSWLQAGGVVVSADVVPLLLRALPVLVVCLLLGGWASQTVRRVAVRAGADPAIGILASRFAHVIILILGATALLDIFGVPPATFLTAIGVLGVAMSLALQDLLKNFFAGIYLLFERPFRLGDTVKVKEHEGVVEHVGIRTMVLKTSANVQILIPNSIVISEVVSNQTHAKAASTGTESQSVPKSAQPAVSDSQKPAESTQRP
jgi:small-conductance mechanosensitive channel